MTPLNVGAIREVDNAVGPGRFLTIWLQGCRKRCRNCMNPEFLPLIPAIAISAEEILARLRPRLAGVCFTGGEPFLQAESLAVLARSARQRGLSVISYTGYTLEELKRGAVPAAPRLLAHLDVLIDGEFIEKLAGCYLWRGSANQRIHLLTNRYSPDVLKRPPAVDVRLEGGSATAVGTANPGLQRLLDALDDLGVHFHSRRLSSLKEGGTVP